MTDNELRQMFKNGPEKGQRAFYDKYFNYVYTIVFARLKGIAEKEDIDECVGDVFAHCFIYLDKNEIDGNMKAFVASVARRRAIDTYRKVVRYSAHNVPIDENEEFVSEENIVEKAEKTELRSILYKKIDELGEPESTIIMQKYFFGRTSKEIADIVSMSADNVRARCSRAVKKLKDMLVQVGYTR
jgi:RNA polymerase sigma-70 factor (ECF subfamily)